MHDVHDEESIHFTAQFFSVLETTLKMLQSPGTVENMRQFLLRVQLRERGVFSEDQQFSDLFLGLWTRTDEQAFVTSILVERFKYSDSVNHLLLRGTKILQRLGRALHVGQSQNVIIAVENVPKLGGRVVDENLKPIGKVVDIFGPVSSPYASVKLTVQASKKLVDKVLYVLPSEKRKGKI